MEVKGAPLAATLAAALLLLTLAAPAAAHPEFSALGTNRYVTLAIVDGRVDVTDTLLEGLLTGGDERRRLDADGDGRVSTAELEGAHARLAAEGPAVTVTIDDRPLEAPVEVSLDLGDRPTVEAAPIAVERRQAFAGAFSPGAHRLRVTVTREPPKLLETELGVMLAPGDVLRGGGDRVTFRGPRASTLETRAATFVVERAPARPRPRAPLFLVALGALAALVVAAAARRRRAR
jgi:hypothetical protein